jgi:hypothetical protein
MKLSCISAILLCTFFAGAASAQVALDDDWVQDPNKLHIAITPYLWFSNIDGDLAIGPYKADFDVPFNKLFNHLKFGAMGTFEARKNRIVYLSDSMYLNTGRSSVLAVEGIPPGTTVDADQKTFMWDNEVGYRGIATDRFNLDALVGLRYWHVNADIDLTPAVTTTGSGLSVSRDFVNPIMATRAQAKLFRRVGAFAKVDIGGFGAGADLTAQVIAGIGFPVKKFGVDLGYRRVYVSQSRRELSEQVTLQGLFLGFTFGVK